VALRKKKGRKENLRPKSGRKTSGEKKVASNQACLRRLEFVGVCRVAGIAPGIDRLAGHLRFSSQAMIKSSSNPHPVTIEEF
jgi:hypothetical protein